MSKADKDAPAPDSAPQDADTKPELASAARKTAGRSVWMGTAAGIGSAAIVAALLYANKKRG